MDYLLNGKHIITGAFANLICDESEQKCMKHQWQVRVKSILSIGPFNEIRIRW